LILSRITPVRVEAHLVYLLSRADAEVQAMDEIKGPWVQWLILFGL
jgi:hypothetical protein